VLSGAAERGAFGLAGSGVGEACSAFTGRGVALLEEVPDTFNVIGEDERIRPQIIL
jgi:hypothetical protein